MSNPGGGGKKSRFSNAGKHETTGVANRGQHGGTINEVLRAGTYLSVPNSFDSFANLLIGDETLKVYPEFEEFRTGLKHTVKETFDISTIENNKDLRSDVERAMDSNSTAEEKDDDSDAVKIMKLKARLSRIKLEGLVKNDIEVIEKGMINRNRIICIIHTYLWIANQSLWRKLNNTYTETAIRSSRDLIWYRSIVIKEVDNMSSMSRGEKQDHVANQLEKVKAYKVNNVVQLGKLITKLHDLNKLYDAYGVDRLSDEVLTNIALNNCRGRLNDAAQEALDRIRDMETQLTLAETEKEKKAVNSRFTTTTTPRNLDDVQAMFDAKKKSIDRKGNDGNNEYKLLMSAVSEYNAGIICFKCGQKGHKANDKICPKNGGGKLMNKLKAFVANLTEMSTNDDK